jgi:hypothetical protein
LILDQISHFILALAYKVVGEAEKLVLATRSHLNVIAYNWLTTVSYWWSPRDQTTCLGDILAFDVNGRIGLVVGIFCGDRLASL